MSSLYQQVKNDPPTPQLSQSGGDVTEPADGNPVAATRDDVSDAETSENQRECVPPASADSSSDEPERANEDAAERPTIHTGRHQDAATGVRRHWVPPEVLGRLQVVLRGRIR